MNPFDIAEQNLNQNQNPFDIAEQSRNPFDIAEAGLSSENSQLPYGGVTSLSVRGPETTQDQSLLSRVANTLGIPQQPLSDADKAAAIVELVNNQSEIVPTNNITQNQLKNKEPNKILKTTKKIGSVVPYIATETIRGLMSPILPALKAVGLDTGKTLDTAIDYWRDKIGGGFAIPNYGIGTDKTGSLEFQRLKDIPATDILGQTAEAFGFVGGPVSVASKAAGLVTAQLASKARPFYQSIARGMITGALVGEGDKEKTLENAALFGIFEPIAYAIGKTSVVPKIIKNSAPWRKMTIKERGLALQSLDEIIMKNPTMTEGEILRKWDNPAWRSEALARRIATKKEPIQAESPFDKIIKDETAAPKVEPESEPLGGALMADKAKIVPEVSTDLAAFESVQTPKIKFKALIDTAKAEGITIPTDKNLSKGALFRHIRFGLIKQRKIAPDIGAGKKNAPYKTEVTAKGGIKLRGLTDIYEPVQVEGGWIGRAKTKIQEEKSAKEQLKKSELDTKEKLSEIAKLSQEEQVKQGKFPNTELTAKKSLPIETKKSAAKSEVASNVVGTAGEMVEGEEKIKSDALNKPISSDRNNIRAWFVEPENWENKQRLTYRGVAEQIAGDKDIELKEEKVPIDTNKPLGETKNAYTAYLDGKKLRSFPKEVYDLVQQLKPQQPTSDVEPTVKEFAEQAQSGSSSEETNFKPYKVEGLKIYKTRIKDKEYFAVQSVENKGTDRIFGDTLHKTEEEAVKQARLEVKLAKEKAERNEKIETKEAEELAKKQIKDADDINGFLKNSSNRQKALSKKVLNKQYRYSDGTTMSIREHVEKLHKNGKLEIRTIEEPKIKPMSRRKYNRANQQEQDAHERKMAKAGNKTTYLVNDSELGKTAYDYAKYLLIAKPKGKATSKFTTIIEGKEKPKSKEPWEMTREQFRDNPLKGFKIEKLPMEDIARANSDGSISLDPEKFFGHSEKIRKDIIEHEKAHFLEEKITPEHKARLMDNSTIMAYRGRNINEKLANMIQDGTLPSEVLAEYPELSKTVVSKKKIGDAQKINNTNSIIANVQRIDGVDYELYNANKLKDKRGFIRIKDVDSGETINILEYPTFSQAETKFNDTIAKASKSIIKKGTSRAPEPTLKAKPDTQALPTKKKAEKLYQGDRVEYKNTGGQVFTGDVKKVYGTGVVDIVPDGVNNPIGVYRKNIVKIIRKNERVRKQEALKAEWDKKTKPSFQASPTIKTNFSEAPTPEWYKAAEEVLANAGKKKVVYLKNAPFKDAVEKFRNPSQQEALDKEALTAFYSPKTNEIYINTDKASKDAIFHEYTHPVLNNIKENNPKLYQQGMNLIEGTPYHKTAVKGKYGDKALDEALTQAIGEKGAQIQEKVQRGKFIFWLNKIFAKAKKMFNQMFKRKITLDDFVYNIANGMRKGKIYNKPDKVVNNYGKGLQTTMPAFPITPGIRSKALREGMPLFSRKTSITEAEAKTKEGKKELSYRFTDAQEAMRRPFNDFMYWVADKNRPFLTIQGKLKIVRDEIDTFLKETQRPKRTAAAVKKAWDELVQPMLQRMAKDKISIPDLEEYAHAVHAPEANKALREANAKRYLEDIFDVLATKNTKPLRTEIKKVLATKQKTVSDTRSIGITPKEWLGYLNRAFDLYKSSAKVTDIKKQWDVFSEKPSGMTDKESTEILKKYSNDTKIENIRLLLSSINDARLDLLYDAGLITTEEYNAYNNKYKHYVPLYREGFDDSIFGSSRGLRPAGRPVKARGGSTRNVINIVANTISNYEKAINLAEKAKSTAALKGLVEENPDPEFWKLKREKQSPRFDKYGNIRMYPDIFNVSDSEFRFMVDGEQYILEVNRDNKDAMLMLRTLKAVDSQHGPILNTLARLNRWLARVNTSWSPEFIMSNFMRDIQTAGININDTDIETKKFLTGTLKAVKAIYRVEQKKQTGAELEKIYDRFKTAGGKIGWADVHGSIEKLSKQLARELETLEGKRPIRKTVMDWLHWVETANTSIENGVRLHVFKLGVEQGLTDERAAQIASDITVDFTKKGAAGPIINSLYLFANAGIQGSYRIMRAVKNPKVRKIMVGIIGFGFVAGLLNSAFSKAEDEGEDYYNKIDDFVRERNAIFMIPNSKGRYIKIPLPWGYNFFYNLGEEASRAFTKENYKPLNGAARLVSTFINAFNPVASGTLLQTIAPTVADPFAQVAENKNWFGGPLMPEKDKFSKVPTPDSQRYWKSARIGSKWVSHQLNNLTGGDKIKGGVIDVSPETLDLIIDISGGSMLRFFTDIGGIPINAITKEKRQMNQYPFVRRVFGEQSEWADSKIYYSNIQDILTVKDQLDAYRGTEYYEYVYKNTKSQRSMIMTATAVENRLSKLRKFKRFAEAQGKKKAVVKINREIKQLYIKFNQKYHKAIKKYK